MIGMDPFAAVVELDRVMTGFDRPWFVSGGWAIDLFVGRVTREHEDIEMGLSFRIRSRSAGTSGSGSCSTFGTKRG